MPVDVKTLGIIAGGGIFPRIVAEAAREAGFRVVAVGHEGETDPGLASGVDAIHWVKLGQLSKIIKALKREGAAEIVLAGGIAKKGMFGRARPDLRAIRLLARMKSRSDDALLRALADDLESEGIKVRPATQYLGRLLAPKGILSRRKPTAREAADIEFGWPIAREIGRLDVGQAIAVKEKVVVAVEGIEGTDSMIRRAGQLARGGLVVLKVSKPGQDARFDLPAVGPGTIGAIAEFGGGCLAVEAGRTIVLERETLLRDADKAGVAVVGR